MDWSQIEDNICLNVPAWPGKINLDRSCTFAYFDILDVTWGILVQDVLEYMVAECIIRPMSYYDNRQRSFNWYNDNSNFYFWLGESI